MWKIVEETKKKIKVEEGKEERIGKGIKYG